MQSSHCTCDNYRGQCGSTLGDVTWWTCKTLLPAHFLHGEDWGGTWGPRSWPNIAGATGQGFRFLRLQSHVVDTGARCPLVRVAGFHIDFWKSPSQGQGPIPIFFNSGE